jgi:hypothetical protein
MRCTQAGPAIEFAMSGLALFAFLLGILNLGLLGFSLGALARGVQAAARTSAVQATASYVNTGTMTCPANTVVAGYFTTYSSPALPAAGTNAGTSNPYINAVWTNNNAGTGVNQPPGVYLTLTGTYVWRPVGFNFGPGLTMKITTVATVPGSSGTITIGASC